jgi:nitroreductase
MAACSSTVPPEAIAAWRAPVNETDVRRWILSHAILAPHSHNLQSWVVDLNEPDHILLRCDLTRLLPETDPFSRQIMMSHGTFVELLDMAARERGLRTEVKLFPDGAFGQDRLDGRLVARIRLHADPVVSKDPLFAQIFKRRTNRSAYEAARPVPAEAWQAMVEAAGASPMRFGHSGASDGAALQRQRDIAAEAWRIELVTPRTLLESLKVMRVGAGEVAQHRDGLTMLDPMVVLMARLGLFDRSKAPGPESYATTSQVKDFKAKMDSTPAFLWMVTEGNDRVTQVNAGRAYARVQLAATAHGLSMQPLSQALQEYPEQAAPYAAIHQMFNAPPATHTVQMWARVGYAPAIDPAPRRGLDAHLHKT